MRTLPALLHLAETAGEGEESFYWGPYIWGIGGFLVLMLLLWITTSFNADR